MSEQLKQGWYWTKDLNHDHPDYWACQYWSGSVWEGESSPMVIGPRIPSPAEPWQSVPKEPSSDQVDAGCEATGECERLGECHLDCDCSSVPKVYRAMLSAAPKPGDV